MYEQQKKMFDENVRRCADRIVSIYQPQLRPIVRGKVKAKADFLSKMTIASKEANETQYWLRLLHDNGYINDPMFTSINKDMERILYKIIAIVKSTKENLNR